MKGLIWLTVGLLLGAALGAAAVLVFFRPAAALPTPPRSTRIELPDGRIVEAPAGHAVRVQVHRRPDSPARYTLDEQGEGRSVGIRGSGERITQSLDMETPQVNLGGGLSAKAGRALYSAKIWVASGTNVLMLIGALLIAGGIVVALKFNRGLGVAMAAAGGALVAVGVVVDRYPWVLVLGLVAVAGVGVWFIWDQRRKRRQEVTLAGVVTGVDAAPPEAARAVKDSIAQRDHTGGVLKSEVQRVKRTLNGAT